jgi:hypothetical protein
MRTNTTTILMLLILPVISSSCVHYYYAPNSNNVPLFKEKNEVRIQTQYSTSADEIDNSLDGFEIQSAYAIGNHTALQLNFFHAAENDKEFGSGYGSYIEAAAGYYKPLFNKRCVFETYSGLGFGSVKNIYSNGNSGGITEDAKTSVFKYFIQPSFGYSNNYFAAAISSKFSLISFGLNNSSLSKENNSYDYDYIESIRNGKSYLYWEPGIMIRAGFKKVQFLTQVTYTIGNSDKLPVASTNFSFGIVVPFKAESK